MTKVFYDPAEITYSESFVFIDCLWFYTQKIMSSATESRCISHFPIYMSFISSMLCWLALLVPYWILVRVSMLALFVIFRENIHSFNFDHNVSPMYFVDTINVVKEVLFYSYFLRIFIMNGCWILSNTSVEMISFCSLACNMVDYGHRI